MSAPRRRTFSRALPWFDRGGHFSPLKAAVLAGSLWPGALLGWQAGARDLGPEPLKAAMLVTGLWSIRLLLLTLAVTPLRLLGHWPRVTLLRRQLGLTCLTYSIAHLMLYAAWQGWDLRLVATEIALRVYLAIGGAALLGLLLLGITSTDGWLRRLRHRWKPLHRLVFPAAALGLLHFFMQAKIDVFQAALLSGCFAWLLLWRALPVAWHARFGTLIALAPAAALATAAIEFAWYDLATGVDAGRVLAANLSIASGLRPAAWVGLLGLAVAGIAGRPHAPIGQPPAPSKVGNQRRPTR